MRYKVLIVSGDMPSHVYASAKLARVYASNGHQITIAAPEGSSLDKMESLVGDAAGIVCRSAGKTATVNQINQRSITNPYSYRTVIKALRKPFPDADAIANMITVTQEGMYEPLRHLIRTGGYEIVIPIHSVSGVVCDAVESLDTAVKLLIFSSMPYDSATYLPARQTWKLTRALSTFPHVSAYSAKRPNSIFVHWMHLFWKWLDTWFTQRAWKKSGSIVDTYRQKRGLEPIPFGYIGYQRKYPSLVVGGVPPFIDESCPVSPQVTVVGTLDDASDARVPVEGALKTWFSQAGSGIVYIGFGTGTKLNENEAAKATGHLFQSLQNAIGPPPSILFALRASEQKRLRETIDLAFGSEPSSESDQHLEYLDGLFRIQDSVPQATLLNSGQVKVFVSHMGMGGYTEGVQAGVPFVCCPSGCDQFFNTARAVDAGIGIRVHREFEDLSECVQKVLLSKSMQDRSKQIALTLRAFDSRQHAVDALEKL